MFIILKKNRLIEIYRNIVKSNQKYLQFLHNSPNLLSHLVCNLFEDISEFLERCFLYFRRYQDISNFGVKVSVKHHTDC